MSIHELRRDYEQGGLDESSAPNDPLELFVQWFADAKAVTEPAWFEPNAMTLATASREGVPDARIVLLKGVDDRGFVFYTNYLSHKAKQLDANPHASLVFHWAPLERQVRIVGSVTRGTRQETIDYFTVRPRNSQLGAWASRQGEIVESREALDARLAEVTKKFEGRDIPVPDFWGGYRVAPESIEFWHGRRSRMHDRLRYTLQPDGSWKRERLSP